MANAFEINLWCVSIVRTFSPPTIFKVYKPIRCKVVRCCMSGWLAGQKTGRRQRRRGRVVVVQVRVTGKWNENGVSSLQRPRKRGGCVDCKVFLLHHHCCCHYSVIHLRGSFAETHQHRQSRGDNKCTTVYDDGSNEFSNTMPPLSADAIQWRRAGVVLLSSHVGVKLNWNTHNIQEKKTKTACEWENETTIYFGQFLTMFSLGWPPRTTDLTLLLATVYSLFLGGLLQHS